MVLALRCKSRFFSPLLHTISASIISSCDLQRIAEGLSQTIPKDYCIHSSRVDVDFGSMPKKIKKTNQNDVLLGRGGKNNQWIGNEKFRKLARKRSQVYKTASKKVKSEISRSMVESVRAMRPPGRFLRKCPGSPGEWEDVGDEIAREKASQVLRDAIQAKRLLMKGNEMKSSGDNNAPQKENTKKSSQTPNQRSLSSECKSKHTPKETTIEKSQRVSSLVSAQRKTSKRADPPLPYGRIPMSYPDTSREEKPSLGLSSISYQYPVTPSFSIVPPSTAKRRLRYYQDSPLVQGYHQYPYPTPIRRAGASRTPAASLMHTPPPKPKKRGLLFSPPDTRAKIPELSCQGGMDHDFRPTPCIPTFSASEKDLCVIRGMERTSPDLIERSKSTIETSVTASQDFDSLLRDDLFHDPIEGDLNF